MRAAPGGRTLAAMPKIVTPEGTFRVRRGTLVRVPDAWVGRVPSAQTIAKRPSKQPRRGLPRPTTRMAVTGEHDVDLHLRRSGKGRLR